MPAPLEVTQASSARAQGRRGVDFSTVIVLTEDSPARATAATRASKGLTHKAQGDHELTQTVRDKTRRHHPRPENHPVPCAAL